MQQVIREPAPMGDINTTPLVDVMLVLLIMFIITIPIQSHAVKIDIGGGPPSDVVIKRIKNDLAITGAGMLLWNGVAVSDRGLQATLAATARMKPQPELHLRPEAAARYERVDQVLVMTKRAGVTRMGFVGNEAFRRF